MKHIKLKVEESSNSYPGFKLVFVQQLLPLLKLDQDKKIADPSNKPDGGADKNDDPIKNDTMVL